MIHPSTEVQFISPHIGYGVVAKAFIPKGTITWVMDKLDREFTPEEVSQMDAAYQTIIDIYAYRNHKGNLVLCWDNARFVNHSFNANCLSTAYDFEIAVRDIQLGEQLTDDYGYLNVSEPFRGYPEGTRRKVVYPDDLLRYHKSWDKKVAAAFKRISKVEQPLHTMLSTQQSNSITQILEGKQVMDSILTNYFDAKAKQNGAVDV